MAKSKKIKLLDSESNGDFGVTLGAALGMTDTDGTGEALTVSFTGAGTGDNHDLKGNKSDGETGKTTSETASSPTKITKAVLQRARAGGGRWVVRVLLTPEQNKQDLETLARELRRAIGTGTRIENNILVVQGDIPDRVEGWLKDHGVKKIVR